MKRTIQGVFTIREEGVSKMNFQDFIRSRSWRLIRLAVCNPPVWVVMRFVEVRIKSGWANGKLYSN